MTEDEFMQKMLEVFPLAEMSQDNDGQIVIYTNLHLARQEDGEFLIVPFDDE